MIRLNKLTDYAIVILGQMATQPTALHNSTQLADKTGVPVATVAKVLKQLASAKLIESQRGVMGGYRLAFAFDRLTVRAVIEAIDGPIAIADCVKTEATAACCTAMGKCPVQGKWDKVNHAIITALDSIVVADMVASCDRPARTKVTQIG